MLFNLIYCTDQLVGSFLRIEHLKVSGSFVDFEQLGSPFGRFLVPNRRARRALRFGILHAIYLLQKQENQSKRTLIITFYKRN